MFRICTVLLGLLATLGSFALGADGGAVQTFRRDTSAKAPLDFEEVWRVGPDREEDVYLWTSPDTHLAVAADGRVLIADVGANRLLAMGPDGTFERVLAAEGPGPGELRGLRSVQVLADGRTVALDQPPMGLARLLFFDASGRFSEQKVFRSLSAIPVSIVAAPDGKRAAGLFMGLDTRRGILTMRTQLVDAQLKPVRTFVETDLPLPGPDVLRNPANLRDMVADVLAGFYRGQGLVTFDARGRLIHAATHRSQIACLDQGGETTRWRVAVEGEPIRLREAERDAMAEVLLEELRATPGMGRAVTENLVRQAVEKAELPPIKNPLFGLLPAGDRLLAVYDLSFLSLTQAVDVLAADGRYLGSLRRDGAPFLAPTSNLTPRMVVHGDRATTLEQDADGELVLVRYRLSWTGPAVD
ncbi:hypothetical protein SCOR_24875 [Sulfidibacter corallicola]